MLRSHFRYNLFNFLFLWFGVLQVRLGKWDEALEMLGEVNPFRGDENEPRQLYLDHICIVFMKCLWQRPLLSPTHMVVRR
jgi:hypothetical protein